MRATAQKRVSRVQSVPVPYGGINEAEPLAAMGEKYAIALDNFFADNLTLRVRSGYQEWATGIGSPVQTLVQYAKTDGTEEMFAATNQGLYDVSGTTDTPVKVADLTIGYVIYTHFSNIAGNYLLVCNGVDPMLLYDGTTWTPFITGTDPWGPGIISGVAPEAVAYVLSYKNRLFFIEKNSLTVWYLPVDAVGGECKPFYYGSVFNRGGTLVQLFSWSLDSGEGLDDKLVAQTSAGEVAIYSGTDPAIAEDWALDAMFFASPPIGPKASEDYGGDVLLLCRTGLLPLSSIVKGNFQVNEEEVALSKRISRTFVALVAANSFTPNWELHNVPGLRAVVVIIPPTDSNPAIQYVMNSNTNAWTRYTIPDVTCGRVYKNRFYFADNHGRVLILRGALDDVQLDGSGGEAIRTRLITAFSYFDDPTTNKHFKLVRPIFQSKSFPSQYHRVLTDFSQNFLISWPLPSAEQLVGSKWDQAKWDVDYWESSVQDAFHPWLGIGGLGFCAALNMHITAVDAMQMTAFEWVYETGGSI
jgi:hypothetical protein